MCIPKYQNVIFSGIKIQIDWEIKIHPIPCGYVNFTKRNFNKNSLKQKPYNSKKENL